jgi:hypothetical protein
MHHDYVDLRVIQTAVEEVNPSPKSPMEKPLSTKEQCSKSTTFATFLEREGPAVYEGKLSDWEDVI